MTKVIMPYMNLEAIEILDSFNQELESHNYKELSLRAINTIMNNKIQNNRSNVI